MLWILLSSYIVLLLIIFYLNYIRQRENIRLGKAIIDFTTFVTEKTCEANVITRENEESLLNLIKELYAKVDILTTADILNDLAPPGENIKIERMDDDDEDTMMLGDLVPAV